MPDPAGSRPFLPSASPDSGSIITAAPSAADVARATAIAGQAFERLAALGLPPSPVFYEIWFNYFSGHHKALNRAIDALPEPTAAALQRIHDDFLSPDRFLSRVHKLTDGLHGEARNLVGLLERAHESSSGYCDGLAEAKRGLDPHAAPMAIETVIAELVRSTTEIMRTNGVLQAQLKKSEAQVQNLQANLEQVQTESMTDVLTATLNRAAFDRTFATLSARAERTGEPLCLVFIDIDHFKHFNDRHGHLVGDDVLRLAALILKQCARAGDVVARLGGDEFAVLLPGTAMADACTVASGILRAVTEHKVVRRSTQQQLGQMSVSIGVAQFAAGMSPEDVIHCADQRLYAAKRAGRNRIVATDTVPASDMQATA
jgi:diguanylate cyclase (GGDEF)-like protein